ncbi:MAG: Glycosyltransferase [uncultured Solirubrobacteraceae bacterium]|uniref:Glycosyltransferase n=1 Tax=uncultured Solirubrobacteraceae bacterium TaxID=1162706 RepID=A0A6J4SI60_9ACTN|nr:MAG: Glycosyltransferase [uncultured Solirubrobacteraceae bacterium]
MTGRAAIVHEWLTVPGGSEKVVLSILELLPQAEIFTSVYDPAPWPRAITDRPVHTSFLNRIPRAEQIYPKLLPLMNAAFESFDLTGFDVVVSSSHSCAKNVITGPNTLHVCYCHTPMRHAWEPRFLAGEDLGPAARLAAAALGGRLRRQDLAGASRPDVFVANSSHVAARIAKYYRRDAVVIHPPVAVAPGLATPRAPDDYYLVFGRLVPYKRADLAVAACASLGRRVKVVGDGRAIESVRAVAGPDAEFLGAVDDAELPALMAGARALIFAGEEDFGIVPVEAQAAGVPVIAYGVGGVRDSVIDGQTGVFFAEQTVESCAAGILAFEDVEGELEEQAIRANAERFAPHRFAEAFTALLAEHGADHPAGVA